MKLKSTLLAFTLLVTTLSFADATICELRKTRDDSKTFIESTRSVQENYKQIINILTKMKPSDETKEQIANKLKAIDAGSTTMANTCESLMKRAMPSDKATKARERNRQREQQFKARKPKFNSAISGGTTSAADLVTMAKELILDLKEMRTAIKEVKTECKAAIEELKLVKEDCRDLKATTKAINAELTNLKEYVASSGDDAKENVAASLKTLAGQYDSASAICSKLSKRNITRAEAKKAREKAMGSEAATKAQYKSLSTTINGGNAATKEITAAITSLKKAMRDHKDDVDDCILTVNVCHL